jgi:hypothetical protein
MARVTAYQRRWQALLCLAALAGLVGWSIGQTRTARLAQCLQAPDRYDGQVVEIGPEARVAEVRAGEFVLQQQELRIVVRADLSAQDVGHFLSGRAVFHKEGWLEPLKIAVARNRFHKIYVSIPAALWVAVLVVRHHRRVRRWTLEFRDRA